MNGRLAVLAAGLLAVGSIAVSTPAVAADPFYEGTLTQTGTAGSQSVTATIPETSDDYNYYYAFCDLSIAADDCQDDSDAVLSDNMGFDESIEFTTLDLPEGCYNIRLWPEDQATLATLTSAAIGSAICGEGDDGDSSGASEDSAPWLQSYGRTQSGVCRTGWHASWAEWAVTKSGGWVCNRTVSWNGSAWVQNPNAVWGASDTRENSAWDGS